MKYIVLSLWLLTSYSFAVETYLGLFETKIQEKGLVKKHCQKNKFSDDFCLEYEIKYPIIVKTKNLKMKIEIEKKIKKHLDKFAKLNAKKEVAALLKDDPDMYMSWEARIAINLFSTTDKTFTLAISEYSFSGGAHGNYSIVYENYSIETGEKISLKDILINRFENKLWKVANDYYRKQNNIMENESLTKLGWFGDRFILSENVALTNKGLDFLYNPYEIKSYADGITTFLLPYKEVRSIMKPHAFLNSFNDTKQKSQFNFTKSFKSLYGEISINSKMITDGIMEINLQMKNLSDYKHGWFSVSFPQISSIDSIKKLEHFGFKSVLPYSKESNIFNMQKRKIVKAQYLLVEGESDTWKKGESKNIRLRVNVLDYGESLYLNLRGAFKTKGGLLILSDDYIGLAIEGQQGFSNYRVRIPLK